MKAQVSKLEFGSTTATKIWQGRKQVQQVRVIITETGKRDCQITEGEPEQGEKTNPKRKLEE